MKNEFVLDSSIKALIFDLDGTIVDTMPAHFEAWQKAGNKLGFELTNKEFYELAGMPATKIASILNDKKGYNLNPQEVEETKADFFIKDINNIKLIDFTMGIIKKYYDEFPMIIGTGNLKKVAKKTLQELNIDKYFIDIVACDDVSNYKPDPETFIKCSDILGVLPKNCIVFEDGDKGIEAAKRANMKFIDVREFI